MMAEVENQNATHSVVVNNTQIPIHCISKTKEPAKPVGKVKKKTLFVKNQPLSMICEWNCCNHVFSDVDELHRHIKDHIEMAMAANQNILPEHCLWTSCGFAQPQTDDGAAEMVRHIFFHAFHSRLKSLGASVQEASNWKGCLMEDGTKNVLPELPDTLFCGWEHCGVFHDSADLFYKHVSFHAINETESKCMWNGCAQSFKDRHRLNDHLRSHTQEKVIACPNCGALFANRTKFSDHLARQQESATVDSAVTFPCFHCDRNFPSQRLLRDHINHHVNHYRCTFCDMTCTTPSSLKSHIRYRHSTCTPYQCTECPYAAKKYSDLRKHLETHVPLDFFKCQVQECIYSCRTYQALTKHYERTHECSTQFECHLCQERFDRGSLLTAHLRKTHHFKWPSGHKRFKYKLQADGIHRLQMVRYESVQLSVIPDEKLVQSLNKDGLDVTSLEIDPPRKKYKTLKPRVRIPKPKPKPKREVKEEGKPRKRKSRKRKKDIVPESEEGSQLCDEAVDTQQKDQYEQLQQSVPDVGSDGTFSVAYTDGDVIAASTSFYRRAAGLVDNNNAQGSAHPYGDNVPSVSSYVRPEAGFAPGLTVPNTSYATSTAALGNAMTDYHHTPSTNNCSTGLVASTSTVDSTVRKTVGADQENLEMLGEVALGFSGLFPRNNDVSPVKFWQGGADLPSPSRSFLSPIKHDAPISDALQTPEKRENVTNFRLDRLKEDKERKKSPRKSSKPKRFSSYADHVTPKRNVLS